MTSWVRTKNKEYTLLLSIAVSLIPTVPFLLFLMVSNILTNQVKSLEFNYLTIYANLFLFTTTFFGLLKFFSKKLDSLKKYTYYIKEGDLVSIKTEYTFNEMKEQSNLKKFTIQKIDIEKQKVLLFQKEDKLFSEVSIDDLEKSYEKVT